MRNQLHNNTMVAPFVNTLMGIMLGDCLQPVEAGQMHLCRSVKEHVGSGLLARNPGNEHAIDLGTRPESCI